MKYLIKKPETFLNTLNEDINSIIQRSFDNLFPEYIFYKETEGMTMPVDVKEFDDKYCVKVELPGIKKEDIKISLNNSCLKIEADKISEDEKESKHKYHKSEFRYGNYSRTIYFPYETDDTKAEAELKNGILKISLPKLQREKKEAHKLEITEK